MVNSFQHLLHCFDIDKIGKVFRKYKHTHNNTLTITLHLNDKNSRSADQLLNYIIKRQNF